MSFASLLSHLRQTAALEQTAGLLSWDQEAMMPVKGAAQRAELAGAMAAVIHARNADPRIPEWIAAIDRRALSEFDAANLREAERAYRLATRIPARLAEESAKAASEGHRVWAAARAAKDFQAFAPALKQILALKREEAACLAEGDGPDALYDALLDQFEPGAKTADIGPMLEGMRPRLTALRAAIAEKPAPKAPEGAFASARQLSLAKTVARRIGYDLEAGRIDLVVHPFCSGTGGDVRITTRVDEADPFNCLYSTIHETGHALYAQGAADPFLPAADYCSMAVHESQSRFWENWVGRSRPFAEWLHPVMVEAFGETGLDGPDALYAAANRVETGFIRTEADEAHYNLHVLLRFELERDLISGALEVDALEAEWNARFRRDFGLTPPDAALGALQDVHWSAGLFGYFPTYALGNVYAACLDAAMRTALPGRDEMLRTAETGPILAWLREKIHVRGRALAAPALIEEATGAPPSAAPLLDHLEAKFGALYDL
ncbi:carboxypeptidase M32 [Pikeienuella piscinae]|uniref:Metal-dependent carboxypeptidase n=1 Tax=Pikeienuella piscinae TaxID=2748098 RepID=A0A7L5BTQ8_9RHOB|nr:carboxypeptidase M32 [Pikeienuella piscinae]QIE55500.1 carboxypeptidase M32 [Pikeienuella piscinae]